MALTWGTPEYTAVLELCRQYLREPSWSDATQSFAFAPPLTTAEQATLADLVTMARFGVTLTLSEWQAIKPEAATLKAYLGLTSPSAAQRLAYEKAVIRILAVIIRS